MMSEGKLFEGQNSRLKYTFDSYFDVIHYQSDFMDG